jgi:hypothetical protein
LLRRYDRGAPYFLKHGNGLSVQGIEEALHTMRLGGRRRVILTPELGFTSDKGPLPPEAGGRDKLFAAVADGRPLVFDLELVDVMDDAFDRGDYEDLTVEDLNREYRQRMAAEPEAEGEPRDAGRRQRPEVDRNWPRARPKQARTSMLLPG